MYITDNDYADQEKNCWRTCGDSIHNPTTNHFSKVGEGDRGVPRRFFHPMLVPCTGGVAHRTSPCLDTVLPDRRFLVLWLSIDSGESKGRRFRAENIKSET